MRSTKRRRLSDPPVHNSAGSETTVVAPKPKPRGFFDLPYELREQ
jgi:hypothetical protein